MQLSEIQAFVAICDQGSFDRAGAYLHLTQPAVSKRLSALETRLGKRLFDRVGRGSVLTEAGRTFLPFARRLLLEVADGRRALDDLANEVSGRLGLALSHHIALHRIPPVLRRLRQNFPAVDLHIEFLGSETACQAIASGRLELAVITLAQPPLAGLEQREIWPDPMQLVIARDHPRAGAFINHVELLGDIPALLPEENTTTFQIVARALAQFDVSPAVAQTSNYLETLKMLATVGLGWTALPDAMIDDQLQTLEIEGLTLNRSLGVVRHPQRSLSNAARALLQLLDDAGSDPETKTLA